MTPGERRAATRRARAKDRRRVLCVDDEPRIVEALALHLHRHYDVVTLTDPREALAFATGPNAPDAIVSDNRMPGMSGVELLTEVRKRAPQIARLLLTGYTEFAAAVAAVNHAGVHRFLLKPCPPDELAKALTDSLAEVAEETRASAMELERLSQLATLGSMAGHIGHEIGNLIAALGGAIDNVRPPESDAATTDFELLDDVRARLAAHATQLKHLARPRSPQLESLDARQLVRRAVEMLEVSGVVKTARPRLELCVEPLPIVVERLAVEGVVINLLKNAGEALAERALAEDPAGAWRPALTVRVARVPERAVIVVEDNGPGMTPQQLESVFNAFYTTKPEGKGTGLGLTIARQTIERAGGQIAVASEARVFTRFSVELPLAA